LADFERNKSAIQSCVESESFHRLVTLWVMTLWI